MNKMGKKGKNMSLQDAGTAQADVAGGKGKNSLYARWGWLAGPLVIAALCLWHGLDVENSVTETGERWLYGWYAGLAVLAMAVTAGLGIELFIRRKMKLETLFVVSVAALGLIYTLVLPPLSAPDEVSHYISAYELSSRLMGREAVNENGLIRIRAEDAWLEDVNDVLADDGTETGNGNDAVILGQELTEGTYQRLHKEITGADGYKEPETYQAGAAKPADMANDTAVSYQPSVRTTPLAYLPQALGFTLARVLGLGSLGLLYMGRLFNLAFFAAAGRQTLKRLPFGKTVVFGVYLLPMNLHLVSSLSYDVLITALCGYFTALSLDLAYRARRVRLKDVALLALTLAVMGPCKMVYGVIAGLCLLIPVRKFGGWGRWLGSAAAVLGAFLCAMAAVNLGTVSMYTKAEDSYIAWAGETGYTFAELLHRPVHVLKLCYDTFVWKGTQLFEGMIGGSLGNQDPVLNTPAAVILALTAILVILALKKPEETVQMKAGDRIWIGCLAVLVLGALMFSMLLAWTPRSASMIEGVQGRYLLPVLPALLLTIKNNRVVRTGNDDRGLLYGIMAMDVYVAVRIFAVVCLRL